MTNHHRYRVSTRAQFGKRSTADPETRGSLRLLDVPLLVHARRVAWPAFLILAFLIPNVHASAGVVVEPTYYGQILRMMQNKCIKCHHAGGIGETDYQNYFEALFYKDQIKSFVIARTMPPWNASPEPGQFPGQPDQGFLPNNELTADQILLMADWVDAGAPAGDIADAPPTLVFNNDWFQGEPDVILEMPVAWEHPDEGDRYRCFLVEPIAAHAGALDEDQVIVGFEVKPSNLIIAHHAVVYIADRTAAEALEAADTFGPPFLANDGYDCFGASSISGAFVLQGWAPGGNSVPLLNENLGVLLPSDKVVINQMHYHYGGTGTQIDRTQLGLKLAPVPKPESVLLVENTIPTHLPGQTCCAFPALSGPAASRGSPIGYGPMWPGETNTYRMPLTISDDSHLVSVFPHMHLIGSAFNVTASHASFPGGMIKIIDLDKWDFDWQLSYNFKQPIALPAGTVLEIQGTYFNDTDPAVNVIGGLFSNQEMLTLGMSLTTDIDGIPTPRDSTPPLYVATTPVSGPSSMALVVDFNEGIALPHYPSAFEITGPGGRVAAPFSIDVSGNMLTIDYDPSFLFPMLDPRVVLAVPMLESHNLLLNGFFGIKDLNENFLDGNGNGVANELSGAVSLDDVTYPFDWSGPELGTDDDPFSTLEGALLAVSDGGTLRISGDTSATLTINQNVVLVAEEGLVRIGV